MKLASFVQGFGTGYDRQQGRERAAKQDEMNDQMMQLRVNADARDQVASDQRTRAAATTAEQAARARGATTALADYLEQRSGPDPTAPAPAPGVVPVQGMPQSGEALVDAPAVPAEDRVGRALYRNPNVLQDPEFLRFAAKQYLSAGMPEGVQWLDKLAKTQEEGGIKALQLLAGGDTRGAADHFNRFGSRRVVGEIRPGADGSFIVPFEGGEETVNPRQQLRFLRPLDTQRLAQAAYLEDRLPSAERVAGVRADSARDVAEIRATGARDVAVTRATAAQIIAAGRRAGGGPAGGTGNNVHSSFANADGSRTILLKDGTHFIPTGQDGKPLIGMDATKVAAGILRELMKDPANREPNKPEAARGLADRVMGTKPPPKPPAERKPLSSFGG